MVACRWRPAANDRLRERARALVGTVGGGDGGVGGDGGRTARTPRIPDAGCRFRARWVVRVRGRWEFRSGFGGCAMWLVIFTAAAPEGTEGGGGWEVGGRVPAECEPASERA